MEFLAELKTTAQSKRALDNVYNVKFETDDVRVMDLGKLPADTRFVVKVEIDE